MAETFSERTEAGDAREIANAYEAGNEADFERLYPVSYTHLTLPTICSV